MTCSQVRLEGSQQPDCEGEVQNPGKELDLYPEGCGEGLQEVEFVNSCNYHSR